MLNLVEFLNSLGQALLVGSAALNLVVKADIDRHLILDPDLMAAASGVSAYLLDQLQIEEIHLTGWREQGGLKLGYDRFPGESGGWSLDIWITDRLESPGGACCGMVSVFKSTPSCWRMASRISASSKPGFYEMINIVYYIN